VVGQLINALKSGKYDPNKTALIISQTGGGCRATNYVRFLRAAAERAGFPNVPVIPFNLGNMKGGGGFEVTKGMVLRLMLAILYGDILLRLTNRTRPYEVTPGAVDALAGEWVKKLGPAVQRASRKEFSKNIKQIVAEFDRIPQLDLQKPKVGVVGEILVKFHPDANNNAVAVIEREGCEAVVPGLLGFFQYCFMNNEAKHEILGTSGVAARVMEFVIKIVYRYENVVKKRLRDSARFTFEAPIRVIAEKAGQVLSIANQCGEGWLLTGEMIELIENGVPNIICAQPFACLPNHVTGKGMIRKLRELFPKANIVPVDYDPGASEVNQLNRIKLMIAGAFPAKNPG
jgi:predicted nucleotide-binding protein (sugar kinase/HSP70/actin superfamily)